LDEWLFVEVIELKGYGRIMPLEKEEGDYL